MAIDLKAIKARADAATAGPWHAETDCFDPDEPEVEACVTNIDGKLRDANLLFTSSTNLKATAEENWAVAEASQEMLDARFIAAARTDVPALCARVEVLERALRDIHAAAQFMNEASNAYDFTARGARVVELTRAALEGGEP